MACAATIGSMLPGGWDRNAAANYCELFFVQSSSTGSGSSTTVWAPATLAHPLHAELDH